MTMYRSIFLTFALALACTRPLASVDDEAGVTTNIGEESTEEESTDEDSTTSTDTSSTTEGPTFVPKSDLPLELHCDPFDQDCPPGEKSASKKPASKKCVPYATSGGAWDDNKCVPVTGDQHAGEPCQWDGFIEATDDCDTTSLCWDAIDIEGELIGQCLPFCTGTADEPECPEGYSCAVMSEGSTAHCDPICDPLLQDCGVGLGCFWANSAFSCIFTAGELSTGEPCGFINDCAPGNYCTDAADLPDCAGAACCTKFCDLDLGDTQCAIEPSTACAMFFELGMTLPGYEDVGICILPP